MFQNFYTIWLEHIAILDLLSNCLLRWSLQIIYLGSLEHLEKSGFKERKMTERYRDTQVFLNMKIVKFKWTFCLRTQEEDSLLSASYPVDYCFKYALLGEIRKCLFHEVVLGSRDEDTTYYFLIAG
jgi:hypothetical protein